MCQAAAEAGGGGEEGERGRKRKEEGRFLSQGIWRGRGEGRGEEDW